MAQMGMDADAVESKARELASRGEQLSRTIQRIDRDVAVLSAQWEGADRRMLTRAAWPQRRAELSRLQQGLADASAVLNRQASEQRRVSAARGGGGGGGATGPKNSPGGPPMERPGSPKNSTNPQVVADWWRSLTDGERRAMIAAYPELIGSANGVTAEARDQANRVLLNRDLDGVAQRHLERVRNGTFNPLNPTHRAELAITENALATDRALRSIPKGEGFLLLYEPRAYGNDGTVAISVGNPDTAANVTSYVPGLNTEMDSAQDGVNRALNLYNSANKASPGSETAVIYSLVYDTPSDSILGDANTVIASDRAKEGGANVANFVNGLSASRGENQPHMSVIGHSYGSTTVSYAFTDHNLKVDDVILIGSPGAGDAKTAADFGDARVWAGSNTRDIVTVVGNPVRPLGTDPSSASFNATRFQAEAIDRGNIREFGNHSKYFDNNSESLANMARIVTGNDEDVNTAGRRTMSGLGVLTDPESSRPPRSDGPNSKISLSHVQPNTNTA